MAGGFFKAFIYVLRIIISKRIFWNQKLRGEGIVCIRNYEGAGNYVEIFAGISTATAIDLYVAVDKLEDAENIIVPVDLDECGEFDFE